MRSKWLRYLLVVLLLLLFRGPIFRSCVRYECTQEVRIPGIQDPDLKQLLQQAALKLPENNVQALIDFSQSFTAGNLHFRPTAKASHPDRVWSLGEAHCIGYAALMGAVLQELLELKEETLTAPPEISQCRGDIYLFGIRLTGPDRPAFFRDHDYIQINHSTSAVGGAYDPSVYDYLWISSVREGS